MNKERIVKYTRGEIRKKLAKGEDKTDFASLDRLTDTDIATAIAADPDAAPMLGDEFWRNLKLTKPVAKSATGIRLDNDILKWFKKSGKGYQSHINAVLRAYVYSHQQNG